MRNKLSSFSLKEENEAVDSNSTPQNCGALRNDTASTLISLGLNSGVPFKLWC